MSTEPKGTDRIKPPFFVGSSHLYVLKFQFETVASKRWDDREKALELILALKAAGLLETMPTT